MIKQTLKRLLPATLLDRISSLRYNKEQSRFYGIPVKEIFLEIYRENHWKGRESISGPGSSIEQTKALIKGINELIDQYQIKSILDIPCGDFHWMQQVALSGVQYIGADIVPELIDQNKKRYEQGSIEFRQLDLIKDELPASDLVLNRDCLVHFSYEHIFSAIGNLKRSGCHYLLTTTFPKHSLNYDITTGDWRPVNFEIAPFHFPPPIERIREHCPPEFEKEFKGKSLALWKVSDLPTGFVKTAYP